MKNNQQNKKMILSMTNANATEFLEKNLIFYFSFNVTFLSKFIYGKFIEI
jgi:hypothetical protein